MGEGSSLLGGSSEREVFSEPLLSLRVLSIRGCRLNHPLFCRGPGGGLGNKDMEWDQGTDYSVLNHNKENVTLGVLW